MSLQHVKKKNVNRKSRCIFHRLFACAERAEPDGEDEVSFISSFADSSTDGYAKPHQCGRRRFCPEQRVKGRKSCIIQSQRLINDHDIEINACRREYENDGAGNEWRRGTERRRYQRRHHDGHRPCDSCYSSKLKVESPSRAAGGANHRHNKRLMVGMLDDEGVNPYADCDFSCSHGQMHFCRTHDDENIKRIFQQLTATMDAKCRSESPMEIFRSCTQKKKSHQTHAATRNVSTQKTSQAMTLSYSSPPHKSTDTLEQQALEQASLVQRAKPLSPPHTSPPLPPPRSSQPVPPSQASQPVPPSQASQPVPPSQASPQADKPPSWTNQQLPPQQTSHPSTTQQVVHQSPQTQTIQLLLSSAMTQQLPPLQTQQHLSTSQATQLFPSLQVPVTQPSNPPMMHCAPRSSPEQLLKPPHSQTQQQPQSHQLQRPSDWVRIMHRNSPMWKELENKSQLGWPQSQVTVAGNYPNQDDESTKIGMVAMSRRGYRLFRRAFAPSENYYATPFPPMETIQFSKDDDQWEDLEIMVTHNGVKAIKSKASAKFRASDGKARLVSGRQIRNAMSAQCYATPSGDTREQQQLTNMKPPQEHRYRQLMQQQYQQQLQQRHQNPFNRFARTAHDTGHTKAADIHVTGKNHYAIKDYGSQVHFSNSHRQLGIDQPIYHQTTPTATEGFIRQRAVLQTQLPTCSSPKFQRERQVQDFGQLAASSRYGKL